MLPQSPFRSKRRKSNHEVFQMSEPDDLYKRLAETLADRNEQVYEIEILSPGFGPLLRDGLNIGITKRALAQAFLIARKVFFDSIKNEDGKCADAAGESPGRGNTFCDTHLKVASEMILLFDSEHLTACNWRKRRLRALRDSRLPEAYAEALREELSFTATLLCSPLHRHAKSPTLWYHRFWVMNLVFGLDRGRDPSMILGPKEQLLESLNGDDMTIRDTLLRNELKVALRAGEQHPMNYYAFSYLRQFFDLSRCFWNDVSSQSGDGLDQQGDEAISLSTANAPPSQSLDEDVLSEVHSWCLGHPGDMSGWTFLFHLLGVANNVHVRKSVIEKTVEYARGISWEGEALWVFVALSISKFRIDLDRFFSLDPDEARRERSEIVHPTPDNLRGWTYMAAQMKTHFHHTVTS